MAKLHKWLRFLRTRRKLLGKNGAGSVVLTFPCDRGLNYFPRSQRDPRSFILQKIGYDNLMSVGRVEADVLPVVELTLRGLDIVGEWLETRRGIKLSGGVFP